MKNYPAKTDKSRIIPKEKNEVDCPSDLSRPAASPFFSFSYSYRSISSLGGTTHIKSKSTKFENGKIETESFEGTSDESVFDEAAKEINNQFSKQLKLLMKPLSFFLPFKPKL